MTTRRRAIAYGVAWVAAGSLPARAQEAATDYPAKAIRLVAPFPPGAPFDAVARRLAEAMSAQLKVPVYVDNKQGAGGSLGAGEVARTAPDGYTLLMTVGDPIVTTPLVMKVPYDPERDFTPIVKIATSAPVLLISTAYKSTSLRELVDEARTVKEPLSYGSFGAASFPQLVLEAFARKAGVKLTEVPYRGVPAAVQDLIGGQIALAFSSPGQAAQLLPQGKVRVLAVIGSERSPVLPQVPTFGESGFDSYFARRASWLGLLGPAKLSPRVAARIGDAVRTALRDAEFTRWMATLDFIAVAGTPAQFQGELDSEIGTVGRFIREELKLEPVELR